jgi:type I restriction enzyme, S subunit
MEVRQGYKLTDAGVIPLDWSPLRLGTYVNIKSGESPSLFEFLDFGLPYFKVEQLNNDNKYLQTTQYKIRPDHRRVPKGSLIFPKRGASILLNKVRILQEDSFMDTNLMTLTPVDSICNEFLYYALTHIELWRIADTTSIPQINNKHIQPLQLPFPPTKAEQEAIAEALRDADAYIESLERLIAKKRLIKQGAMQELLTGKKRLPGFSGEWKENQLGMSATLKARIGWQGLTTSEYRSIGDYYLVTGTEFQAGYIMWDQCHHVDKLRYDQDKNIQVRVHDVLVTKDGTIGKVAIVDKLPKPATLNSGVFVIRPINDTFHPEFFYYLLSSSVFTSFLNQLSAGSTINHLYQKDFVKFRYKVPVQIEEQVQIADVLAGMDGEIHSLAVKLFKAREIKQGMMQELLTGKIRLV